MERAKIAEIFTSTQGEGIYTGLRQIFIRFYGCNISPCHFCDTKLSGYQEYSAQELLERVNEFKDRFYSVSITGGEPLLHKDFLKEFLPMLRQAGKKIYLETNGTLPDELADIIDFVDTIAMDFKLPSSSALKNFWYEHRMFLKEAAKKEVFAKAVITSTTMVSDIEKMLDIISDINPFITLVLQPVTPIHGIDKPSLDKLLSFKRVCENKLKSVEVIPQMHKVMGVR